MRDLTKEHHAVWGCPLPSFIFLASHFLTTTAAAIADSACIVAAPARRPVGTMSRLRCSAPPSTPLLPPLSRPWATTPRLAGLTPLLAIALGAPLPGLATSLHDAATGIPAANPFPGVTLHLTPAARHDASAPQEETANRGKPAGWLEPFLIRPLVVDREVPEDAPRIVATPEARAFMGPGDRGYVRGMPAGGARPGSEWQAFRPGRPVRDPLNGEILGYEAIYLGNVQVTQAPPDLEAAATPATPAATAAMADMVPGLVTVVVTVARQEIGPGTFLLPQPPHTPASPGTQPPSGPQAARKPGPTVVGRVAAVYDGMQYAGAGQVVVLNVGVQLPVPVSAAPDGASGLAPGDVVGLSRAGIAVPGSGIVLPSGRYGRATVFRVFPRLSYALVTNASQAVQVGDLVGDVQ